MREAASVFLVFLFLICGCAIKGGQDGLLSYQDQVCVFVPPTVAPEPFIEGPMIWIVLPSPTPIPSPTTAPYQTASITFYCCEGTGCGYCGSTASGEPVRAGVAACGNNYQMGTRFIIEGDPSGQIYECLDRGLLAPNQVDIFFWTREEGDAWFRNLSSGSRIGLLN